MKKLLCVIMSAIMLSTTVFAVSAADVTNSVSATPDEAQEQTAEGYCDGFYYSLYKTPYFENFCIKGYDGSAKDLVVPSELNGHKVRYIDSLSAPNADDSTVETVTISDGIQSINWLFRYNSHLKHVYINSKTMTFEQGGHFCDDFRNCPNLESIELCEENENYSTHDGVLFDKSVNALVFCPEGKQGSYKIPDSVTWIYDDALNNCKQLTELIFPNSITVIDSSICYNCENLKRVEFGDDLQSIGSYAFSYCTRLNDVVIPNVVRSIGDNAFFHCDSITEITIPDSVTSIGERAFSWCDNLKTITLGKGVSELGENFVDEYSSNLENIFVNDENEHYVDDNGILFSRDSGELLVYPSANKSAILSVPDGITTLPDIENHTLTEINIPASVTQIGNINEKLLKNINVSPDNPHFYSINGILFSKDTNEMLCYPPKNETTELTIPDGVDKMCAINSDYLKTLNIPSSVSEIGNISCNALENINVSADNQTYCSIDGVLYNKSITEMLCFPLANEITDYHIPDSVAELKGYFENAKHLKNIYIPQSVTEFGRYSFTIHGDCIENIFAYDENPNYYSENGILYYKSNGFVAAYPENNKTTDFHIPEGVPYVYSWYFLRDCHYVENVYVPQTAKFNYSTMQYCDNLKNVFVDENNSLYCDIDGVMYSKDKTKLLLYPRGRNPSSISFPATVREIDGCAFYKCNDLTTVVLPERMVRVYGYEFLQCENLRDITFPKGIKQIYGIGYQIGGGPGAGGWIIGDIDNVVIRGYTNSPAETYAKENGFTFISLGTINKLGDSNSDNKVDITDATNIQRYLAEYEMDFSENEEIASDTNGDGHITISDVTEIQRFIAELPSAIKTNISLT